MREFVAEIGELLTLLVAWAQLDASALEALDFLVNRYLVKPALPGVPPKNVLMQVIREVGEDMGL